MSKDIFDESAKGRGAFEGKKTAAAAYILLDLKEAAFRIAKRGLFVTVSEEGENSHLIVIDMFSNTSPKWVSDILREEIPHGWENFIVKPWDRGAFHRSTVAVYRKKI